MKFHFSRKWLEQKLDEIDEPVGCAKCGAIAGCCDNYPACQGVSCFVCGQLAEEIGVQHLLHLEIVCCAKCKHASDAALALAGGEGE